MRKLNRYITIGCRIVSFLSKLNFCEFIIRFFDQKLTMPICIVILEVLFVIMFISLYLVIHTNCLFKS